MMNKKERILERNDYWIKTFFSTEDTDDFTEYDFLLDSAILQM